MGSLLDKPLDEISVINFIYMYTFATNEEWVVCSDFFFGEYKCTCSTGPVSMHVFTIH